MADKYIADLDAATQINATDLFVVDQHGAARKMTAQLLVTDFAALLDGHGGIANVTYTDPVSPSLNGTMTLTFADATTAEVPVATGRGISGISWATSGTAGNGQVHTGTISYNDGTTSTVTFTDGVKGDTGAKGDTGDASTVTSATTYQESLSGTTIPSGTWSSTITDIKQGRYLWTRTILTFNNGSTSTFYSVAYQGEDGEAQVDEIAEDFADEFSDSDTYKVGDYVTHELSLYRCVTAVTTAGSWNSSNWQAVTVTEMVDGATPRYYFVTVYSVTESTLFTISDEWITSDTIVVNCDFSDPSAIASDNVSWSSTTGSITFTGSSYYATTAHVVLANKGN